MASDQHPPVGAAAAEAPRPALATAAPSPQMLGAAAEGWTGAR